MRRCSVHEPRRYAAGPTFALAVAVALAMAMAAPGARAQLGTEGLTTAEIEAGVCSPTAFSDEAGVAALAASSGFDRTVDGLGEGPVGRSRPAVLGPADAPPLIGPRDQACIAAVLEVGPAGRAVAWTSDTSGARHVVMPGLAYAWDSTVCRVYHLTSLAEGRRRGEQAIACRAESGAWQRFG